MGLGAESVSDILERNSDFGREDNEVWAAKSLGSAASVTTLTPSSE